MCKRRVVKLDVTSGGQRFWRCKAREGDDGIICASIFSTHNARWNTSTASELAHDGDNPDLHVTQNGMRDEGLT